MDYNAIVSAVRTLARDELRLLKVNEIRTERLEVSSQLSQVEKNYEELCTDLNHRIAVLGFRLSQIVPSDPDKETKSQQWTEESAEKCAYLEVAAKDFAKTSENLKKELARIDLLIADVQSGKTLVGMEDLESVTARLLSKISEEVTVKIPLN